MNHNAPELIRYLVALTGGDPCQIWIFRGKQWHAAHTQRIGDVRLIAVVTSRCALPHLADIDETAPGTVSLHGIITAAPPDNAL